MIKKIDPLIALSIFLLSFILRLLLISKGPYHVDCLNLATYAEQTLTTQKLHYLFGSGYPLTVILGAVFLFIFRNLGIHDAVLAVNFMSVLFSSLCILLNYYIVKNLLNKSTATLSSIMFSLFPFFLGISVYGKSHTPSLFFLLLGILSLIHFFQKSHFLYLFLSSVSLGLMGAARAQDLLLMGIPLAYLFLWPPLSMESLFHKNKKFSLFFLFWFIILTLTFFFHLPLLLNKTTNYTHQFSNFWNIGLLSNFRGFLSPSLKITFVLIIKGLSPLGLLISIIGFFLLIKKHRQTALFLFLWFLIPLTFYGNLYTTCPRFLVISLIPMIISQAYAFSFLSKSNSRIIRFGSMIVYLTILFLIFSSVYPILLFRHKNALLPDFAKWISKNTEPHARIIAADEYPFIDYYTNLQILERPIGIHQIDPQELKFFKSQLDISLNKEIPVYITDPGLYTYNPKDVFSKFIFNNYEIELKGGNYIEDWHKGEMVQQIYFANVYRIYQKSKPAPNL